MIASSPSSPCPTLVRSRDTYDMTALRRCLPKVLESTLLCYSGYCSKCAQNSVICHGSVSNNWWNRSMFLASNKIHHLNMDESDKILLLEILKMKLSTASSVEQMKLFTRTRKSVRQLIDHLVYRFQIFFLELWKDELILLYTN